MLPHPSIAAATREGAAPVVRAESTYYQLEGAEATRHACASVATYDPAQVLLLTTLRRVRSATDQRLRPAARGWRRIPALGITAACLARLPPRL